MHLSRALPHAGAGRLRSLRQHGFSLLEVCISMAIFGFGLLGLANLQMVGLASNQGAALRTTAITLGYDMADRVRANLPGAVAGAYNLGTAADNACRAVHYNDAHATPAVCTIQQLAKDDLYDWGRALAGQLPSGSGVVCIDSTPDDGIAGTPACDGVGTAYVVKIWWTDKPKNSAALTRRVTIGFQP